MAPFRTRGDALDELPAPSDVVRDAVWQMVRQFADPYACFRELVQNSIDAGATAVDVRVGYEPDGAARGVLRVVVSDDGCGMDVETVEKCLLVLFRSSKDGDPTKIGKLGVGFFSVFALEPEVVRVDTGTGAGGWRLTLRPDYSYELEEIAPRRGTTVTLRVPTARDAAAATARRALEALARWCPHVAIPLRFATVDVPGVELAHRVDAPFGIDAPAAVVHRDADGALYALGAGAAPMTASFRSTAPSRPWRGWRPDSSRAAGGCAPRRPAR